MHIIPKKLKIVSSHTGRKITLGILLFLSIVVIAGIWYWNTHKKQIIRDKLENAIAKKSDGLYKIKYDSLGINEIAGDLSVTNMNIVYDSTKYAALIKNGSTPSILLKINIPGINISGVKTPRALIDKEIVAHKLQITNPTIEIFYTHSGKDSSRHVPAKEIYEQILGNLSLIRIDSAEIRNATIITKSLGKEKDSMLFTNTNITLVNVNVDSTSSTDTTRVLFAKEMNFTCEKLSWYASTKLYRYTIDQIVFNSADKDLTIQHIGVNPQLSEDAFAKSLRFQSDRFDADFNMIRIKNVSTRQLMNEELIADALEVNGGNVKIYRDLNIRRDNINRSGTYPHQQIMLAPIPFLVPKAIFSNIFIGYREKNDITKQVGDVRFYNCFFNINNLTNKRTALEKNNICSIDLTTRLLNVAPAKVSLLLPIGNKEGKFSIEGSAGGADATTLNKLIVPMGMARIKKGNVNSVYFKLKGNNYRADGSVTVLYDNLNIEFLEMDDDKTFNKKHITSFISNIVLKNSNPDDGETRVGEVHHERDMNRSFYNLIWKSVFEGMNKTIGNKRKMKRP